MHTKTLRTPDAQLFAAAGALLFEADSPVGKALLDRELRYVAINDTLALSTGLDPKSVIGLTVAEVIPAAYPTLEPLFRRVLDRGEAQRNLRINVPVPSAPDEVSEWEATYLPVRLPDGSVAGILVQAVNLTLERRAERALQESSSLVRRVLDGLFAFVGVMTTDGVLLEANRAPLEAAGISLADVTGRPFWDTYWWSYSAELQAWMREAVARAARGELVRKDVVVRMAGDTRMTIDFMLAPLRDEQGRITHLIPSAIDITERLATEARFRRVFESARTGLALIDEAARILLANPALAALLRLPSEGLQGRSMHEVAAQADLGSVVAAMLPPQSTLDRPVARTVRARAADGTVLDLEIAAERVSTPDGTQTLLSFGDIGEALRARRQIETALAEKTVLLQEVHHRVKNNLQIIASLLRLQARQSDAATQRALQDSQNRVMAMALTHQLLYERKDFSALEFGPYLRRLCGALRDAHGPNLVRQSLVVDAPAEGLRIELNQAVPLALCTNELVTNALKHAFPGERRGEIRVVAAAHEGGIDLCVRDDGIGLPHQVLPESGDSLGFSLVKLLTAQIGARFEHESRPGHTEFRIHLPDPPHE
jgi:PAS domain S-box-containing protein